MLNIVSEKYSKKPELYRDGAEYKAIMDNVKEILATNYITQQSINKGEEDVTKTNSIGLMIQPKFDSKDNYKELIKGASVKIIEEAFKDLENQYNSSNNQSYAERINKIFDDFAASSGAETKKVSSELVTLLNEKNLTVPVLTDIGSNINNTGILKQMTIYVNTSFDGPTEQKEIALSKIAAAEKEIEKTISTSKK